MSVTTYRNKFEPIPSLAHLGPSPEHATYVALMPAFWEKVDRMEAEFIGHGWPATGFGQFARDWFAAWANQDVDALANCMTEDCGFVDSSTFQVMKVGREKTLENCEQCFSAFPDMAFYPQDDSDRSLPYATYFDAKWRAVIPWRGIARFSGRAYLPDTNIQLEPTGACLNFIGVDRYLVSEDWKIAHIDTDWDMAYAAAQLLPFKLPSPPAGVVRGVSMVERAVMPALRRLGRNRLLQR